MVSPCSAERARVATDEQEQQFSTWVRRFRGVMFKVIRSYAADRREQEDLFQEISLSLWRSLPSYRGECSESTWVYRVALNTAIAWLRKGTSERRFAKHALDESVLVANESDDRLAWLYQEIRKLGPVDRSVVLLYLDGNKYSEIAQVLGISESNVGVKINRIKKVLSRIARKGTES